MTEGFPPELFLQGAPPDDFDCSICHLTMRDPVRCDAEHLFCRACIDDWMKTSKTCPVDRKKLTKKSIVAARMASSMMDKLQMKCPSIVAKDEKQTQKRLKVSGSSYADTNKCSWTGTVGEVAVHLKSCEYVSMTCPNRGCSQTFMANEKDTHKAVCEYARITCTKCQSAFLRKDSADHHNRRCPKRLIKCSNTDCDADIPADQVTEHTSVCPMQVIACPLRVSIGCKEKKLRKDMGSHAGNADAHMGLMLAKIVQQDAIIAQQGDMILRQDTEIQSLRTAMPMWSSQYFMWYIRGFNPDTDYEKKHVSDDVMLCGYTGQFKLIPHEAKGRSNTKYHGIYLKFNKCVSGEVRCDFRLLNRSGGVHHEASVTRHYGRDNNFEVGIPEFISAAALKEDNKYLHRSFCMSHISIHCTVYLKIH